MNMNATLLGQTISFILFVWFCKKYVWPPLMAAIEKRQQEISDGLAAAQRGQKDLELVQERVKKQLKEAKQEASLIVEQAVKRQNEIIAQASILAQQEREKLLNQAHAEIESERRNAREELRKQVAHLAVVGAEHILRQKVDAAVHADELNRLASGL